MKNINEVTQEMIQRGIRVHVEGLNEELSQLESKQERLVAQLTNEVAAGLNISKSSVSLNSTKQMVQFIYGYLGAPVVKVTGKKKEPSLAQDVLEVIKHIDPIIAVYSEYNSVSRLAANVRNLLKAVGIDGKIHSYFNPNGAVSGRFTSSNPNLQQITPSHRKYFVADEGFKLLTVDMHQAEYQLAFQLAGVQAPKDVHQDTADKLNISRPTAKVVNLGILYGMTGWGLGQLIGTSESEGQKLIDLWHRNNPEVSKHRQRVINDAMRSKKVSTIQGHTVYDNFTSDARAYNILIQGSLAGMIKTAMCKISDQLEGTKSGILLTEHDELVVALEEAKATEQTEMVLMEMSNIDGYTFTLKSAVATNWTKD